MPDTVCADTTTWVKETKRLHCVGSLVVASNHGEQLKAKYKMADSFFFVLFVSMFITKN